MFYPLFLPLNVYLTKRICYIFIAVLFVCTLLVFMFQFILLFRTSWRGEPLDSNVASFRQSFKLHLFSPALSFLCILIVLAVSLNVFTNVQYCVFYLPEN